MTHVPRQDEFLRSLLTSNDLLAIREAIKDRLPKLMPVAYENHDLSAGFSTTGITICGDPSSIAVVEGALNAAHAIETFWRPQHNDLQKKAEAFPLLVEVMTVLDYAINTAANPMEYISDHLPNDVVLWFRDHEENRRKTREALRSSARNKLTPEEWAACS